jgi:undecaprenyl-diphosphatase
MFSLFLIFGAKYLIFVLILIAVASFFLAPKAARKKIALFGALLLPLSYIFAKIAGRLYFHPRPFVLNHFTPFIPHAADNGFPSDHTLLAAAISLAVFSYNKKLGIALGVLTIGVGASRVLAGVHAWIDILGSIVIALVACVIVQAILQKRTHLKKINAKKDAC